MANATITLRDGLKIGETTHTEAEIRDVTASDLIEATAESEKLVNVPDEGAQFVTSPALVGINTLRRQIVRIGDHKGPLSLAEIKRLSAVDLWLLQATVNKMDAALRGVAQRGRD